MDCIKVLDLCLYLHSYIANSFIINQSSSATQLKRDHASILFSIFRNREIYDYAIFPHSRVI